MVCKIVVDYSTSIAILGAGDEIRSVIDVVAKSVQR